MKLRNRLDRWKANIGPRHLRARFTAAISGKVEGYGAVAADRKAPIRGLALELKNAIALDEIEPHFQPIIDLETGRVRAFEALARWMKPSGETVPPSRFIELAENIGVVGDLTYLLLRKACMACADWPADVRLSFNISPRLLQDPTLAVTVVGIVRESGMDPRRLEIEITETDAIEDEAIAARLLNELSRAGILLVMDDFGTGHSNLERLSSFGFDKIKIDRSFLSASNRGKRDQIVRAIVELGRGLGLPTTVEGIETREQLERLRSIGCTYGQGYLFGRAVPAKQAALLLSEPPVAA